MQWTWINITVVYPSNKFASLYLFVLSSWCCPLLTGPFGSFGTRPCCSTTGTLVTLDPSANAMISFWAWSNYMFKGNLTRYHTFCRCVGTRYHFNDRWFRKVAQLCNLGWALIHLEAVLHGIAQVWGSRVRAFPNRIVSSWLKSRGVKQTPGRQPFWGWYSCCILSGWPGSLWE